MSGFKWFPWRNKDELNKAELKRAAVRVMHSVTKFKPRCNSIRCLGWAGLGIPVKRQVIGVSLNFAWLFALNCGVYCGMSEGDSEGIMVN